MSRVAHLGALDPRVAHAAAANDFDAVNGIDRNGGLLSKKKCVLAQAASIQQNKRVLIASDAQSICMSGLPLVSRTATPGAGARVAG